MKQGNYEIARYNELKLRVLSKHVVSPDEDKIEFDDFLFCLMSEHQPGVATEGNLVEEISQKL